MKKGSEGSALAARCRLSRHRTSWPFRAAREPAVTVRSSRRATSSSWRVRTAQPSGRARVDALPRPSARTGPAQPRPRRRPRPARGRSRRAARSCWPCPSRGDGRPRSKPGRIALRSPRGCGQVGHRDQHVVELQSDERISPECGAIQLSGDEVRGRRHHAPGAYSRSPWSMRDARPALCATYLEAVTLVGDRPGSAARAQCDRGIDRGRTRTCSSLRRDRASTRTRRALRSIPEPRADRLFAPAMGFLVRRYAEPRRRDERAVTSGQSRLSSPRRHVRRAAASFDRGHAPGRSSRSSHDSSRAPAPATYRACTGRAPVLERLPQRPAETSTPAWFPRRRGRSSPPTAPDL